MSFNRLDDLRSSYHGMERRGRSFFRRTESPLSSPLFRRKQFSYDTDNENCSSRDSSQDRREKFKFHDIVDKVRSGSGFNLKQRLNVMRSGSFSDVSGAKATLEAKRKRWLIGRSESLRQPNQKANNNNWWSSSTPECSGGVSGSATPIRDRSMDRVHRLERRGHPLQYSQSLREYDTGKVKGFVNR